MSLFPLGLWPTTGDGSGPSPPPIPDPGPAGVLAVTYCTDEDIAIYAPSDVHILTPKSSAIASGLDGRFEAGGRWTLISDSADFGAQGVQPRSLIHLEGGGSGANAIPGSGQHFAVGAVDGHNLWLRRIGFAEGTGQPPGPDLGATGVKFTVFSLAPQINAASDEINRRYGIDPRSINRSPTALDDVAALKLATVLTVLVRQYTAGTRTHDGDFALKLRRYTIDLDAVLAKIQLRWRPPSSAPPSSTFRMKINRG